MGQILTCTNAGLLQPASSSSVTFSVTIAAGAVGNPINSATV